MTSHPERQRAHKREEKILNYSSSNLYRAKIHNSSLESIKIFRIKLKKILSLLFALSISASPALSWGGNDCPFSKKGTDQNDSNEKIEKSKPSQNK